MGNIPPTGNSDDERVLRQVVRIAVCLLLIQDAPGLIAHLHLCTLFSYILPLTSPSHKCLVTRRLADICEVQRTELIAKA